MKYYELTAGEKTYRIRVRMQDHAELDQLCGGNFMESFREDTDPWGILKACIVAGCRAAGDMKPTDADAVIDALIDNGCSAEDAVTYVMEIGTVSGFFSQKRLEAYRKAMAQAKAEELETESANA